MPPRRFAGLTALHVLLLVALLEVAVNRVAVPMLRPVDAAPPSWHTYLDYAGLFLFQYLGNNRVLDPELSAWAPLIGFGTLAAGRWGKIRT